MLGLYYQRKLLLLAVVLAITLSSIGIVDGFSSSSSKYNNYNLIQRRINNDSNSGDSTTTTKKTYINTEDGIEFVQYEGKKPSGDWELDCYSRPVIREGGKKLWDVLITDSTGSFQFCKTLPSNKVNSKELRQTIEELTEDDRIETKPSTIRFFRGAMFNMINIALSELDVIGRPSRCTYSVAQWLEERHKDVYPNMEG